MTMKGEKVLPSATQRARSSASVAPSARQSQACMRAQTSAMRR